MSECYGIYLDASNTLRVVLLEKNHQFDVHKFIGKTDYSSYDAALSDLIEMKQLVGIPLTLLEKMKLAAKIIYHEKRDEAKDEKTERSVYRLYRNAKEELVVVTCNPLHCTHIRNRFYSKEKYATEEAAEQALIEIKQRLYIPLTEKEQVVLQKKSELQ